MLGLESLEIIPFRVERLLEGLVASLVMSSSRHVLRMLIFFYRKVGRGSAFEIVARWLGSWRVVTIWDEVDTRGVRSPRKLALLLAQRSIQVVVTELECLVP